ncbi:MAG: Asp-tRNA(Asn)/Glu-tRNA(Gln) amidotransferase GatCAB subunit A [Legionellales bacterium]|nr:Asp-tRNA(Asn)/Glu-tRNA(Gln) amidotransferase GatCAB subunit A [Legionellales bacterium]
MHQSTLTELSSALELKKISSEELTRMYIERCKKHNNSLNCFITISEESAIHKAKIADKKRASGDCTPLTGIPIAQKDIFCVNEIKTTCGSKMLSNFIAPYDATLVKRMDENGFIMLGKTNMDEFAMGSSNETSFFGPVKNPWNVSCVPGGSSGGSASAVAARLCPAATGTDTGGSIRQPASFCGITGLKPTYGRVSRYGMIAFASSLDQGGPMTQTAEDAALIMNVISGFDKHDSTSVDKKIEDYTKSLNNSIKGLKIGLPKQYFEENLNSEVADITEASIKELEKLGAKCIDVDLPNTELSIPAYYVVAPAECSSNLSRYDGVRFGHRCDNPKDLIDLYSRSRQEGFGKEVKRRIMIGTYVLSAGYYDAYYLKAQKVRQIISDDFKKVFKNVDILASPTTTGTAFQLNEKLNDPISMYLSDIYTVSANLAGLPAISIPSGFIDALPVGMQLIGNYFQESLLMNVAHQYQKVTDWHQKIPSGYQ